MDLEDAENAQIQEAMRKVDRLETSRLEVDKDFQDYGILVSTWCKEQLSQPGSNYSNLRTEMTDFNSRLNEALKTINEQDRDRNLGTLETDGLPKIRGS